MAKSHQFRYSTSPIMARPKPQKSMLFFTKRLWITLGFVLVLVVLLLNTSDQLGATIDNKLATFVIHPEPTDKQKTAGKKDFIQTVSVEVRPGDTFGTLMQALQIEVGQVHTLLAHADAKTWLEKKLRSGQVLELVINSQNMQIQQLDMRLDPNTWLKAMWQPASANFHVAVEEVTTEKEQVYAEGTITQSLFVDAVKQDIPASVVIAFANIFAWDIDYAYDIRAGDSFRILYQKQYLQGKHIPLYNILVAEFTISGKTLRAYGYSSKDMKQSYFTDEGKPLQKPFLRMPLEFGRVSSSFNLKRVHPLFGTVRPHKGTDYAAPRHTPIHSIAHGKISFRGKQRGYGKMVVIDHDKGITTLYAHMQNFVKRQKVGTKVRQGDTIGYVGTTGYATGPHVHMEFKINGKPRNIETARLPTASVLHHDQLPGFLQYRNQIAQAFELHHKAVLASNVY